MQIKQTRLVDIFLIQLRDPAHHQPAGDVVGVFPGGKRRERDFGDVRRRDPPLCVLIEDRIGVLDRFPPVFRNLGDRAFDVGIHAYGDRHISPRPQGGIDTRVTVIRGIRPDQELVFLHPG